MHDSVDSEAMERAVVGKMLTRLIPFLAILYVFCLVDRTNVGIAAPTMQKDLDFSDRVYAMGAGIFFIGYFLFEVPSNLMMERVGARRWIARIMVSWGLISAAMMFVGGPISFYFMRFTLGLAEAGFYPGVMLYLTYWVPATLRARVISRFLALTGVLGLIGGPLGGLLLSMDGLGGLQGWQWLFLLEGIPSVLLGLVVWRVLPDGPKDARWLSGDERAWLAARLERDASRQERVPHLNWLVALKDPRIVTLCMIFILSSTGGNAVSFFGPKLILARSGGAWSDSFVATVGVIPAIVGAVAMSLAAAHSDRTGRRRLHVVLGYAVAGLGFLLCVPAPTGAVVILALSVTALGERIAAGSYWAATTNVLGPATAAGGLAMINSIGNLGGFFGPLLMGELRTRSGGAFPPGLFTAAALMMAASAVALLFLKRRPASAPAA